VASPSVIERLERLEAEGAILRTLYAYGHAIDYGDEEAWVDCFTEDGVFDVRTPRPERFNSRLEGRDELRRFVASHSRAPERWHKHLVIEPVVQVDGETATCESYFGVLVDHEGMPFLSTFGRYLDRLARGADGRWRFRERLAEVESLRNDLPSFIGPRATR
jgi:ketosteroid isomerase-like protein